MSLIIYIIIGAVILLLLSRALDKKTDSDSGTSSRRSPSELDDQTHEPVKEDSREASFWEVEQPFPVKATLHISYEDADGMQTERTVDVRQFGANGSGGLIRGRCRLRNANRTFRTDRITSCVDGETGEVVKDAGAYLRAKHEGSPEHKRETLLVDEYDTLRILLYVGKADGQLRAAEKAVIRNTCRALVKDSSISDEVIDDVFTSLDVPSIDAFKRAIKRVMQRKSLGERLILIKAAQDMVATQKTVHASEKQALEYMEQTLAVSAP